MTTLAFDILARDRASAAFRKVGDSADRANKGLGRLSGGFKTLAKVGAAAGVVAAGVGIVKLTGFLKDSVAEGRESIKISALTAAAIKSTGAAANVTASQVSKLATAISNKTAVDDEAIQSSSNLLLTFTNVRNEVGKGNDIFNQATQATVDMAAVLGGSASDNAIRLGKALNDPIRGVSALSKVGVSFTAQQKKQIKTLVESGKTLEAQKIILKELAVEFGGAAAAVATPADRLKVSVGNLKESIGGALIPTLDKLATFAVDRVLPALGKMGEAFKTGKVTSGGFTGFLERVGVAAREVGQWITGTAVPAIKQLFAGFASGEGTSGMAKFGVTLRNVAMWVRDEALPALQRFGGYIRDTVIPVVQKIARDALPGIKSAVKDITTAFRENEPQIRAVFKAFKEWIDWLVTKALPVLGPILSKTFTAIGISIGTVITVFGFLVDASNFLRDVMVSVLQTIIGSFLAFVGTMLTGAVKAFGWMGPLGGKLKNAKKEFDTFASGATAALDRIKPKVVNVSIAGAQQVYDTLNAINRAAAASGTARVNIGQFAHGGRPPVGVPAIVGEKGPEWFVPDRPGRIYPNGVTPPAVSGQAGQTLNVTVNNPLPERASESVASTLRRRQWVLG